MSSPPRVVYLSDDKGFFKDPAMKFRSNRKSKYLKLVRKLARHRLPEPFSTRCLQLITLADTRKQALECFSSLDPTKTRVRDKGFTPESLDWIDWREEADKLAVRR